MEISNIPFKGPIAGVRVGLINGQLICNPSSDKIQESEINIFMVGRKVTPSKSGKNYDVELVMMEGDAKEVAENVIVDAIQFGLEAIRPLIDLQDKMREAIGKAKRPVAELIQDEELIARVSNEALSGLKEGYICPASWNDTVNLLKRVKALSSQSAETMLCFVKKLP